MGWAEWGDWCDVPTTTCEADSDCVEEGWCMHCINTLHEAQCESSKKGTFLAYSWGNAGIIPPCYWTGTGGNCWAEVVLSRNPCTFIPILQ